MAALSLTVNNTVKKLLLRNIKGNISNFWTAYNNYISEPTKAFVHEITSVG